MTTRLERHILRIAQYLDTNSSPSRSEVIRRIAKVMSESDLLRRAALVTETDFHSAFSSTSMENIQKIYDGPIFSGDRPTMMDLWSQFTYARAQVLDESEEKDPEHDAWVAQVRSIMEGLGL